MKPIYEAVLDDIKETETRFQFEIDLLERVYIARTLGKLKALAELVNWWIESGDLDVLTNESLDAHLKYLEYSGHPDASFLKSIQESIAKYAAPGYSQVGLPEEPTGA